MLNNSRRPRWRRASGGRPSHRRPSSARTTGGAVEVDQSSERSNAGTNAVPETGSTSSRRVPGVGDLSGGVFIILESSSLRVGQSAIWCMRFQDVCVLTSLVLSRGAGPGLVTGHRRGELAHSLVITSPPARSLTLSWLGPLSRWKNRSVPTSPYSASPHWPGLTSETELLLIRKRRAKFATRSKKKRSQAHSRLPIRAPRGRMPSRRFRGRQPRGPGGKARPPAGRTPRPGSPAAPRGQSRQRRRSRTRLSEAVHLRYVWLPPAHHRPQGRAAQRVAHALVGPQSGHDLGWLM